jgi:hypothetical protein
MATDGDKLEQLCDFLKSSFGTAEFQMFLTFRGGGFAEVAESLNPNDAARNYFYEAVVVLERKGLITAPFFDHLRKELPAKQGRIQSLAELWL